MGTYPGVLSRRSFLAASAAAAAAASCGGPARPRPNILLLMPDQYRGTDLGVMGNPDVQTPNMDRLAAEGALIRQTYANSPVCCPARGTLLTGRYGHQHGVDVNDAPLPDDARSIAEILREQGYRTGFVGKWHLEGGIRLPGFVEPGPRRQGFDFWAANICTHNYWNMQYFRDDPEPIDMPGYSAQTFTDEAIEFIAQDPETPFLCYLQWGPPHNPYTAPPAYMNLYDPEGIHMRDNWQDEVRLGSRNDIAGYYAAITFLDDEIGRILQVLEETGQAENTVILLTSDHGDMLGSQGTYLKRKPWEESIQVPGVLRYPAAVPAGLEPDILLSHVDVVPTLLGLAGVDPEPQMTGRDLSPALLGEAQTDAPKSVYLQSYTETERGEHPAWRGVRTARYTYARSESAPWVLYDNQEDPYQQTNLVDDPAHAETRAELDAEVDRWFTETNDSWKPRADLPYR